MMNKHGVTCDEKNMLNMLKIYWAQKKKRVIIILKD